MSLKDKFKELVTMLSSEKVETNLDAQMLKDGITTIEAETFEVGSNVHIVTETENVPLPIGNYELEDGRILVVEVEGVIASVGEASDTSTEEEVIENAKTALRNAFTKDTPETEEVKVEAEEVIVTPVVETEEVKVEAEEVETPEVETEIEFVSITDFNTEIGAIKTQLEELKASLNLAKETISTKETEIESLKVDLSKLPAAKRINTSPEGSKTNNTNSKPKNKFEAILHNMKNQN